MRTPLALVLLAATALSAQNPIALGGSGRAPYFEEAVDKIAEALQSDGVKVKVLPGDSQTRTLLLDEAKDGGFSGLLYVTLHQPREGPNAERGDLTIGCYVNAKKVWEEKAKGPLVLPGSTERQVEQMADSVVKKIVKRAGEACLRK